jgi:hypothetical protein
MRAASSFSVHAPAVTTTRAATSVSRCVATRTVLSSSRRGESSAARHVRRRAAERSQWANPMRTTFDGDIGGRCCEVDIRPVNITIEPGPAPGETVTDDQPDETGCTRDAIARGRALLMALGIRDAPTALAVLAYATFEAAGAADLPALDAGCELAWLHAAPGLGADVSAEALELCEATPTLARRLPNDVAVRAHAARFELEETLGAIARSSLFERFER